MQGFAFDITHVRPTIANRIAFKRVYDSHGFNHSGRLGTSLRGSVSAKLLKSVVPPLKNFAQFRRSKADDLHSSANPRPISGTMPASDKLGRWHSTVSNGDSTATMSREMNYIAHGQQSAQRSLTQVVRPFVALLSLVGALLLGLAHGQV